MTKMSRQDNAELDHADNDDEDNDEYDQYKLFNSNDDFDKNDGI